MVDVLNTINEYLADKWVNIFWIVFLFTSGKVVLSLIIRKIIRMVDDGNDEESPKEKQVKTLGQLILTTGNIVIYSIVLMMILDLFLVDITPLLAGAGIAGVAIGLGTQTLVQDLVSGLFILLEHRYSLGDTVKLDNFEGKVVKITMRSTVLKDKDGKIFYISNGAINKVENHSQGDNY